jgi:hypothetical protein
MKKLIGTREREWKESNKRITHGYEYMKQFFRSSFAQKEANLLAFQAYDLL